MALSRWVKLGFRQQREQNQALVNVQEWIAPTFATNWSNFSGSVPVGYYMDPLGVVHIRGSAAKAAAVVATDTIFTLPANYRPSASLFFITSSSGSSSTSMRIQSDGTVSATGTTANATRTGLDGLRFRPGA